MIKTHKQTTIRDIFSIIDIELALIFIISVCISNLPHLYNLFLISNNKYIACIMACGIEIAVISIAISNLKYASKKLQKILYCLVGLQIIASLLSGKNSETIIEILSVILSSGLPFLACWLEIEIASINNLENKENKGINEKEGIKPLAEEKNSTETKLEGKKTILEGGFRPKNDILIDKEVEIPEISSCNTEISYNQKQLSEVLGVSQSKICRCKDRLLQVGAIKNNGSKSSFILVDSRLAKEVLS